MGRDNKPYVCSFDGCSFTFSRPCRLEIHMRTHTGERPYVCSFDGCNKTYTRSNHLSRHEETHTEKGFKCIRAGCGITFKTSITLKKHVDNVHLHLKSKTYKCKYCDAEFNKHNWLKAHEFRHTKIMPYVCPHEGCGKEFIYASRLKRHMKTHEGYPCSEIGCDHYCDTWSLYLKHMHLKHAADFKCEVCNKMFKTAARLKVHQKVHKDVIDREVFLCTVPNCSSFYTELRNLTHHLKKYHGQRPFQCLHLGCSLAFKTQESLDRHGQVHDPNIPVSSKKRKKKLKQKKKKDQHRFAAFLSGDLDAQPKRRKFKNRNPEASATVTSSQDHSPREESSALEVADMNRMAVGSNESPLQVVGTSTSSQEITASVDAVSLENIGTKETTSSGDHGGRWQEDAIMEECATESMADLDKSEENETPLVLDTVMITKDCSLPATSYPLTITVVP